MPENNHQSTGQSTSSHMMKTTKRGRPFLKVRLCRFSTSIPGVDRWRRRHVLSLLSGRDSGPIPAFEYPVILDDPVK